MKTRIFLTVIAGLLFAGCSQKEGNIDAMLAPPVAGEATDSTAEAKVIKTADMRFRVKDVANAKSQLSETVNKWGGTITEVSVNSYVRDTEKVKYTADSLMEINAYETQGLLVARIPSEKLNDFTSNVSKLAIFVDQQSLKMDDQSITYLENRLKARNRIGNSDKDKKAKRDPYVDLMIKDDLVDKQIENMRIDDKVRFSTITLNFYQHATIMKNVVPNDRLKDHGPGFFHRLWLNLADGWTLFKELLLGLSRLWMIFLLITAAYLGYRYYKRR